MFVIISFIFIYLDDDDDNGDGDDNGHGHQRRRRHHHPQCWVRRWHVCVVCGVCVCERERDTYKHILAAALLHQGCVLISSEVNPEGGPQWGVHLAT